MYKEKIKALKTSLEIFEEMGKSDSFKVEPVKRALSLTITSYECKQINYEMEVEKRKHEAIKRIKTFVEKNGMSIDDVLWFSNATVSNNNILFTDYDNCDCMPFAISDDSIVFALDMKLVRNVRFSDSLIALLTREGKMNV